MIPGSEQLPVALHIPGNSPQDVAELVEQGGFRVAPVWEAWNSERIIFQSFLCGRGRGLAVFGVAVLTDGSELPLVTVHTCRTLLKWFRWPADRKLVRALVAWLISRGAVECPAIPPQRAE